MKKFEAPTMEVEKFAVEDVVTTSGGNGCPPVEGCDYDTGDI